MAEKKTCCVKGCLYVGNYRQRILYAYPPRSTPRFKRWQLMFPKSFDLRPDKSYICCRHFTPESFDDKSRLRHSADPTVNIDTSYAQDIILRTFITKVLYEWCRRNCKEHSEHHNEDHSDCHCKDIARKAREAKEMLGMPYFNADRAWLNKFEMFRDFNVRKGTRFGKQTPEGSQIYDIIKEMRQYLPSNFALPIDAIKKISERDRLQVKNECDVEEEADVVMLESSQDHEAELIKEAAETAAPSLPEETLDTYQDALELLQPLQDYIESIGNQNALVRLQEIEMVITQFIESEKKPRKGVKRSR